MLNPLLRLLNVMALAFLLAASSGTAQTRPPAAPPTKQVVQYLDHFQRLIRQNALYADSINWEQLSREIEEKARGLTTVEDCRPVLDYMLGTLRQAGDQHSFFLPPGKAMDRVSSGYKDQQAQSRYLGNGIAYLKVPEFVSMNPAVGLTFSQSIRSQLQALEAQHTITGWVVDLRHNTGGNMHPMISGLQPLLGDGIYGYLLYPRRKKETPLLSRSGKAKEPRVGEADRPQHRVAVLIDSLTASSGEMVALALRGLPNTRFFGQRSAGYTTSNQTFRLPDGALLLLATAYMADRNRNTYPTGIVPEVIVDYSPADAPDKTVEAASRWLLKTE
ncbi:S41 family peptidase [Hymenobacter tenuis]